MADRASRYSGGWEEQATPSPAIGLILFAAVMMILVGIFHGVLGAGRARPGLRDASA
jgi:hypothetical protein